MNSFEVQIRLTTNFLGGGRRKNGVRKLRRTSEGLVALDLDSIVEDLDQILVAPKKIKVKPGVDPPRVNLLRRIYNKVNVDRFEGIEAGSRLSIYCTADNMTTTELRDVFNKLGKLGISQFGRKFNCGRFSVISTTIDDK